MYKYILQIKYKPRICSFNQSRDLPKMDCLRKICLAFSAYYKTSLSVASFSSSGMLKVFSCSKILFQTSPW